jgi:phosphatidylethanolamine N-methyltransferase
LLLGLKCFHSPPEWSFTVLGQYLIGFFLCIFNWWAKVDAHRCIGSYSWFWGDFFFRKDLHLTFDGIFELFPHPMYTVGYSLYYGYSLIARSYTMLFVSLIAHGMQLAFLFFVEEPHIKRTYGSPPAMDKSKSRILYDPKSGLFPDKNDNVFLSNFDLFRSGDFSVFFFSIYGVAIAFLPSDPWWSFMQVVLWRVIHWLGLGSILWAQSSFQLWTRHFSTRGRPLFEAFGHWKNTYNLSLTMNIVVFIACSLRYVSHTFTLSEYFLNPFTMASAALGLVLISLSIWSYTSTYEAVGEFGWFYGDFFISESK